MDTIFQIAEQEMAQQDRANNVLKKLVIPSFVIFFIGFILWHLKNENARLVGRGIAIIGAIAVVITLPVFLYQIIRVHIK